jgi:hypothetical protein
MSAKDRPRRSVPAPACGGLALGSISVTEQRYAMSQMGQRRRCRSGASRQVSLNKRTPAAETALQATARAVDAIRLPQPGRGELRKRQLPLVSKLQPVRSPRSSYYHAQIACWQRGGQEGATEHDTDQNLACRPTAAAKRLGGHAGAACQRRDNGPRGDRRTGHAGHRGNGEPAGRNWYRLHRRRRVLDRSQPGPLQWR